jgi:hypothetical protein
MPTLVALLFLAGGCEKEKPGLQPACNTASDCTDKLTLGCRAKWECKESKCVQVCTDPKQDEIMKKCKEVDLKDKEKAAECFGGDRKAAEIADCSDYVFDQKTCKETKASLSADIDYCREDSDCTGTLNIKCPGHWECCDFICTPICDSEKQRCGGPGEDFDCGEGKDQIGMLAKEGVSCDMNQDCNENAFDQDQIDAFKQWCVSETLKYECGAYAKEGRTCAVICCKKDEATLLPKDKDALFHLPIPEGDILPSFFVDPDISNLLREFLSLLDTTVECKEDKPFTETKGIAMLFPEPEKIKTKLSEEPEIKVQGSVFWLAGELDGQVYIWPQIAEDEEKANDEDEEEVHCYTGTSDEYNKKLEAVKEKIK